MLARILVAVTLAWWASAAAAAEIRVKIGNFTFQPVIVILHPGDTVRWENEDDIPHTVTESSFRFHSEALDTGDAFAFTFRDKGEFTYFCSLHPHMVAKVVVVE